MKKPLDDVLSKINNSETLEVLKNLIGIQSVSGNEEEIGFYLAKKLEQIGLEVEVRKIDGDRANVLGTLEGDRKAPTLILEGHMDTVEAYDMLDPFTAKVENGTVLGRGAVDMKGGLAAMLIAAKALAQSNFSPRSTLITAFTIDEEKEKKGGYYLLNENGISGDMAIVTEPTNNEIMIGQMGVITLEVDVKGRSCHGMALEEGVNAIEKAADFTNALSEFKTPVHRFELDNKSIPVSGSYLITKIEGGGTFCTVPSTARLLIKRATCAGESAEQVVKEINEIIEETKRRDKEFQAEVRLSRPDWNWPIIMKRHLLPALVSENESIVETLKYAYKILGKQPKITFGKKFFWTHQDFFVNREPPIPAVILGPGDPKKAHSAEECVQIEDVVDAAKIYALTGCLIGESIVKTVNK